MMDRCSAAGRAFLLAVALAICLLPVAGLGAEDASFVRDGLLLSWEARKLAAQPDARALPDDSVQKNNGALIGAAKLALEPPRIELDGKSALVGSKAIRPERISVEAAFRVERSGGPLQLIVTTFPPKGRPPVRGNGNPRQWVLEIRGDPPQGPRYKGFLEFGIFGEDGNWHMATSNRRITKGWHHALGTFDGQTVRLFLDGRLQRRARPDQPPDYQGRINRPPDGTINLPAVGSNLLAAADAFQGAIALARIYCRALSDREVARNHAHAQTLVPDLAKRELRRVKRMKPPFKVLFSNDFTNILTCTSPYHNKGQPYRGEMLGRTVDETPGADVHMLQPAHGWVPWWPSKVYPLEEHHRWWQEHFKIDAKDGAWGVPAVHRHILDGGDPFKDFIERCRARGQKPFISLRLNDLHHLGHADTPKNKRGVHAICRFYVEHPEYRLGGRGSGHNWAIPEARAYKFALIKEICENYDIDGFELDFMRHPKFFKGSTPREERVKIITDFVADVRKLLDRTARQGQRRWLCARVPCKLSMHDAVGIDLAEMVDAGLDMVNLSPSYFTCQDHDLALIREELPDAAIYLEMCHCTMTGKTVGAGGDNFLFLRTTDQQYYTTAHLAYRRGADGVSLFNFVYTREHGTPGRGPFNEPPFHILKHLADPEWLARQPQWYVLAANWFTSIHGRFTKGDAHTYRLDMAPTAHQRKDGIFRLMTREVCTGCRWMAKVNGTTLARTDFVRKPLDHPYEAGMGDPRHYACFKCPRAAVKDGVNKIAIILEDGGPATVHYLDLVLP